MFTRTLRWPLSRSHGLAALVASCVALAAAPAHADDKATCAAAYETGQEMRNKGEFKSAREQLVLCAKPTCKDWMVAECTKWLDELERKQPTIVLTAENERGEVVDLVKVIDESGRAIAQGATGRAIALDPGPHQLTFIARDGSKVVVLKMIQEGQQAIPIKAVFEPPKPVVSRAQAQRTGEVPPRSAEPQASPWRTAGWITAGVGVVGIGVGAALGLVAMSQKGGANCDANGVCDPGSTSGIESAALGSTLGFVAGSVLLAAGVGILVFGPRTSETASHSALGQVRITPTATTHGGALVLGGTFQ